MIVLNCGWFELEGAEMKTASRRLARVPASLLLIVVLGLLSGRSLADPLTLRHAVELALAHSSAATAAAADQHRALASYREVRNQYVPQLLVGSGLGKSWGFPLSLEGSAPAILNVNAQSALLNPALQEFVHAARNEWQASTLQTKNQRDQVMQDAVLSYLELAKWEGMVEHLRQYQADAEQMDRATAERIAAGVDSNLDQTKARLGVARARLRVAQAQGAVDVLREHLAQLMWVPASTIEIAPSSVPSFPEVTRSDDLVGRAAQNSPVVQAANTLLTAQLFRARGEHRSLWPQVDFAAQYALLSRYNNYDQFYQRFERHNATVGVAMRFPFLNFSQRARAEAADAAVVRARKDAETTRAQVSEETLRLQRSLDQLSAAQQVADLEYQVAQSDVESVQVRMNTSNVGVHELQDARTQANERYCALQDANFELQRARVALLRSTGELNDWVGIAKARP